ncbi:unnamed protein product [Oppiella nova]|uniref:Uncharacterized protein n=1 Tax=Oppiella nova TaxID=334625 RepID=A0A7R9LEB4_9ACAR|nr:unnamed protein product [Oppiella nova]CAG2162088.1 unnamed protein product [Oppiella nova]
MSVSPIFRVIPDYEGWKELEYNRISELLCASKDQIARLTTNKTEGHIQVWPELESDPVIRNLFTAIILFNPNRPNLTHRHNVQLEQQLYIYLLQRYLLLKCRSESESKLQNLMESLKDFNTLREIQMTFGLQDCKQYFGPLIREIYDFDNNYNTNTTCSDREGG